MPDDQEGSTWSIMVTFKLAYAWTDEQQMQQFMYTVLTNQEMIVGIVHDLISPFGGHPYWRADGGMQQVDAGGYQLAADLGG